MYPISKMSAEEKEMLINQIACYADCDGQINRDFIASPVTLLNRWNQCKSFLFEKFQNQLILEKQVQTNNSEEIRCKMDGFLDSYWFRLRHVDIALRNQSSSNHAIWSLDSWTENQYLGDTFELFGVKFSKGMKPMKMLIKIIELMNKNGVSLPINCEEIEQMRLEHSRILNLKTQAVKLCLSIHPLDYTTMSDNDGSWSSCMSWQEGGDYRQGTVEMMNSPFVVVAYIKSDKDIEYPWGTWNNKRWRQLFIVDHHRLIVGSTQYPYNNNNASQIALDWLRDIMGKEYFEDQVYDISWGQSNSSEPIVATVNGKPHYDIDFETNYYYNDMRYGNHFGYIGKDKTSWSGIRYGSNLFYSGGSQCMCCGNNLPKHDRCHYPGHTLICLDCARKLELSYECECCCETFDANALYFSPLTGELECKECIERNLKGYLKELC